METPLLRDPGWLDALDVSRLLRSDGLNTMAGLGYSVPDVNWVPSIDPEGKTGDGVAAVATKGLVFDAYSKLAEFRKICFTGVE
jgi:hypothetical protein